MEMFNLGPLSEWKPQLPNEAFSFVGDVARVVRFSCLSDAEVVVLGYEQDHEGKCSPVVVLGVGRGIIEISASVVGVLVVTVETAGSLLYVNARQNVQALPPSEEAPWVRPIDPVSDVQRSAFAIQRMLQDRDAKWKEEMAAIRADMLKRQAKAEEPAPKQIKRQAKAEEPAAKQGESEPDDNPVVE